MVAAYKAAHFAFDADEPLARELCIDGIFVFCVRLYKHNDAMTLDLHALIDFRRLTWCPGHMCTRKRRHFRLVPASQSMRRGRRRKRRNRRRSSSQGAPLLCACATRRCLLPSVVYTGVRRRCRLHTLARCLLRALLYPWALQCNAVAHCTPMQYTQAIIMIAACSCFLQRDRVTGHSAALDVRACVRASFVRLFDRRRWRNSRNAALSPSPSRSLPAALGEARATDAFGLSDA
jgi:hypothetical protein